MDRLRDAVQSFTHDFAMSRTKPKERTRNPSFRCLFGRGDTRAPAQASNPRSTTHAAAAKSSLTTLIKDLRREERQVVSLSSTLVKERADHKKHLDELKAAHAKELAIVNENHVRQLAQAEVNHKEETTRVKLWCEMNRPRPNELSRVLERQQRSALQAELGKTKEEAELRSLWNEARVQELEREKSELEHWLTKMQKQ